MSEFSSGYLTGLLKPKYRVITNILGEQYFPDKGLDVYIDLNTFVSTLSSNKGFLGWLPFSEKVEEEQHGSISGVDSTGCTYPHIVIVSYGAIRTDSAKTHIVVVAYSSI